MPPRRYLILESDSISGLREQVSQYLAQGWDTCGGLVLQEVPPRPAQNLWPAALAFTRYLQAIRLPLTK